MNRRMMQGTGTAIQLPSAAMPATDPKSRIPVRDYANLRDACTSPANTMANQTASPRLWIATGFSFREASPLIEVGSAKRKGPFRMQAFGTLCFQTGREGVGTTSAYRFATQSPLENHDPRQRPEPPEKRCSGEPVRPHADSPLTRTATRPGAA